MCARTGLLSIALLFALGACAAPIDEAPADDDPSARQVPSTAADIRGVITHRSDDRILVEENPDEQSGSAKASVRLHGGTTVLRRAGGAATAADLRQGQTVSVWFDGPVMESYPVQTSGGTVVIERDG